MEIKTVEEINRVLIRPSVSSRVLLSRLRLVAEESRNSPEFTDSRHAPFFYHLGKHLKPKRLLQFGLGIGLESRCLLKGCTSVERFVAVETKTDIYYSTRLARKNISDVYKGIFETHYGMISDEECEQKIEGKWDMILVTTKLEYDHARTMFDTAWSHLEYDGHLVVDYLSHPSIKTGFSDFCRIVGRTPIIFKTRYETGVVER